MGQILTMENFDFEHNFDKLVPNIAFPDRIVVPHRHGHPSNPVYFPPALRNQLRHAPDQEGGRSVYGSRPEIVFPLDVGDAEDMRDVDRVEDLALI